MEITNNVIKMVQKQLPGVQVEVEEVRKNNGVIQQGVSLRDAQDSISQVVYISEMALAGYSAENIAAHVIDAFKKRPAFPGFLKTLEDYECAKKHLSLRLVNRKANQELFKDAPYKDFLDLAVMAHIDFLSGKDGVCSSVVNRRMLDNWNVPFDDVYKDANANFRKEESVLSKMSDTLKELGYDGPCQEEADMYVLTNRIGHFGAVHMLKTDILDELAHRHGSDIVVLPSSVHEVLLVPEEGTSDVYTALTEIVREVNKIEVKPEEVLSDHVYLYSLDRGALVNLD